MKIRHNHLTFFIINHYVINRSISMWQKKTCNRKKISTKTYVILKENHHDVRLHTFFIIATFGFGSPWVADGRSVGGYRKLHSLSCLIQANVNLIKKAVSPFSVQPSLCLAPWCIYYNVNNYKLVVVAFIKLECYNNQNERLHYPLYVVVP